MAVVLFVLIACIFGVFWACWPWWCHCAVACSTAAATNLRQDVVLGVLVSMQVGCDGCCTLIVSSVAANWCATPRQ
jgi:hypothetical protein